MLARGRVLDSVFRPRRDVLRSMPETVSRGCDSHDVVVEPPRVSRSLRCATAPVVQKEPHPGQAPPVHPHGRQRQPATPGPRQFRPRPALCQAIPISVITSATGSYRAHLHCRPARTRAVNAERVGGDASATSLCRPRGDTARAACSTRRVPRARTLCRPTNTI